MYSKADSKSLAPMIVRGQLAQDPDIRYTPAGVPVAKLLLLSTRFYRDKCGDLAELPPEKFTILARREVAERIREVRLRAGAALRIECVWQQNESASRALVASDFQICAVVEAT